MQVGKKIFYDKLTGDVITDTGERQGSVIATTVDQDITAYTALFERNRATFEVIELEFGAHLQDFAECNGYRVNLTTLALEFSYPDPGEPETPPVFVKPLSTQIAALSATITAQASRMEQMDEDNVAFQEFVVNEVLGGM